jgi:hypothetical protein
MARPWQEKLINQLESRDFEDFSSDGGGRAQFIITMLLYSPPVRGSGKLKQAKNYFSKKYNGKEHPT